MDASESSSVPSPSARRAALEGLAAGALPRQELMLRQARLLRLVMDAWFQPAESALEVLYEVHDALVVLDDGLLGPAGANALSLIGHYVRVLGGRGDIAQAALERAERWARRHDDKVLQCYCLIRRAMANEGEELGLSKAIRMLGQALALARNFFIRDLEVSALLALAQRLLDSGMHADAAQAYRRIDEMIDGLQGDLWTEYRMVIAGNLSWASILAGHYDDALAHLDRWFAMLGAQDSAAVDPRHVANAYENRAQTLLGLKRNDEALACARLAREWADKSQSAYAVCGADLALGRALVANGQAEAGLVLIQQAVETSRAKVPRHLHDALLTAARVYEELQQPESAMLLLHELYLLRKRKQSDLVDDLEAETARQLALEHKLGELTLAPIREGMAEQPSFDASARRSLSSVNLLLEEHAVAAERLDDTTGAHCYRVGRLAALLGQAVGLGSDTCFLLEISARLHDVGKLMVPDELLMKPTKLSAAERQIMQRHTLAGWEILAKTNVPQMHIAQEIALHHHEWWDGSGYPHGIAGHSIPISARVSALADVFDALTHVRPYKSAWPVEEALAEIESLKGVQFDPELTDVFFHLVERLRKEHGDLDALLGQEAARSTFVEAREEMAQLLKGSDPSVSAFQVASIPTAASRASTA